MYELEADIGIDGALVIVRFLLLLRNHLQKLVPDLVLEKNFCAFHLETYLDQLKWDFLVTWKLIKTFHYKVIFS